MRIRRVVAAVLPLESFAAAGGGDSGDFAVFGDGAAGQFDALLLEFDHDLIVGQGVGLVFVGR